MNLFLHNWKVILRYDHYNFSSLHTVHVKSRNCPMWNKIQYYQHIFVKVSNVIKNSQINCPLSMHTHRCNNVQKNTLCEMGLKRHLMWLCNIHAMSLKVGLQKCLPDLSSPSYFQVHGI